jgi:hypothetical protein
MAFKFKAKEILGATGTFSERLTVSGVSVLTGININTGSFVTTGQTGSFLTTSSNVVYATGNQTISGIKTFSNQTNVSGIKFNILSGSAIPPTFQEGFTWYDDDSKSLSYYNDDQIQVRVGQEQLVRGTNSLSTTLTKGQVVYITGAGGLDKFPGFQLSIASTEMGSARTIGVVANDIGVNEKGYVISFGRLEGIDTTAYNVGDTLYLSSAVSGGFTGVKPQAPIHMVRVGTVLKQGNSANGVIFVTVQNGFELDELHDVRITNPQNSEAILWNSTSGVWTNRQINTGDISGASNFITTSQTGVFVTTGQTGAFASAANLASTGSNLQTQITSLSGTLTDNYVTINTNQTIIANKTFSAQSFIVKDSPSETNVFDFVADDYFYLRSFGGIAEIGFNSPVGSYVTGFQNIYATNIYENGYSVITTNDTGRFNTLNVTGLDLSGKIFISGINGTTVTTNGQTILISSSGGSSSPSSSGTTLPIIFKTVNLTSGLDNSFIQFPSNFGSVPTVLANIINDIGDPFLGFNISGISISGFNLSTSTQIPNNNYKLSYLATTGDGFLTVGTTTGALYGQMLVQVLVYLAELMVTF